MKQQEVFKKIGGIINELKEQYEYLESVNNAFNDLELELLAANSQFLTDHIEVLRKLNRQLENNTQNTAPAVAPPVSEDKKPEPSFFEPEAESTSEGNFYEPTEPGPETQTFEFDVPRRDETQAKDEAIDDNTQEEVAEPTTQPEVIKHELSLDDIGNDWDEDDNTDALSATEVNTPEIQEDEINVTEPAPEPTPEIVEPIAEEKEEPIAESVPEPVKPVTVQNEEPVADPTPVTEPAVEKEPVFKPLPAQAQVTIKEENVVTYNQRILAQLGNTSRVSDQLSTQPVADLKSAISLNDKLLYIKDLFNGYSLAYSEAIDLLNRMKTFEEAEKFLTASYATKNNWKDKQDTANKLFDLLRRKFNA